MFFAMISVVLLLLSGVFNVWALKYDKVSLEMGGVFDPFLTVLSRLV